MVDVLNEGCIETKIMYKLIEMLMEEKDFRSTDVSGHSILSGLMRLVKDFSCDRPPPTNQQPLPQSKTNTTNATSYLQQTHYQIHSHQQRVDCHQWQD
ncbi:hypothetical protein ACB094_04G129500 [Castanea mollissima]